MPVTIELKPEKVGSIFREGELEARQIDIIFQEMHREGKTIFSKRWGLDFFAITEVFRNSNASDHISSDMQAKSLPLRDSLAEIFYLGYVRGSVTSSVKWASKLRKLKGI